MSDAVNDFLDRAENESHERMEAVERLVSSADASKVFGVPVVSGERTVITAAQVGGGGGFGSGMGMGMPKKARDFSADATEEGSKQRGDGAGGGGGGGGRSSGRPVAVIVIGPEGVEVKPILDVTKITLTALAAFGVLAGLSVKKLLKK
jgi:uncharacterized spore protein YtfJ